MLRHSEPCIQSPISLPVHTEIRSLWITRPHPGGSPSRCIIKGGDCCPMPFRCVRYPVAALFVSLSCTAVLAQSAEPSPDTAAMQKIEDSWDAAVAKHDQFALDNLLSRDYVGIGADGVVTTRNHKIAH